jgi:hypothetical protein
MADEQTKIKCLSFYPHTGISKFIFKSEENFQLYKTLPHLTRLKTTPVETFKNKLGPTDSPTVRMHTRGQNSPPT